MARPPAIQKGEIQELLKKRDKVVLTTGDIAKALDVHRNTAHDRLKKLEQSGEVQSDTMGSADVWYLSNDDPRVEPALNQPWSLVGVIAAAIVAGVVTAVFAIFTLPPVVYGVTVGILTFAVTYREIAAILREIAPGLRFTFSDLETALAGGDK